MRRERKNSNSSSVSSVSSYSTPALARHPKRRPPPKTPKRASSAPLISVTTPPTEFGSPLKFVSPSPSSSSSPLRSAPVQMFPLFLPFLAPPTPHPHFVYGPVPQCPPLVQSGHDHLAPDPLSAQPRPLSAQPHPLSAQPHPYTYNMCNWNDQATDANSALQALQPAWANAGQVQGHTLGTLERIGHTAGTLETNVSVPGGKGPLNIGHVQANGQCNTGGPQTTPPDIGGCGPAQGFYSLLNNKELTSDPPSSIWTPPSSGHWEEAWPDHSATQ